MAKTLSRKPLTVMMSETHWLTAAVTWAGLGAEREGWTHVCAGSGSTDLVESVEKVKVLVDDVVGDGRSPVYTNKEELVDEVVVVPGGPMREKVVVVVLKPIREKVVVVDEEVVVVSGWAGPIKEEAVEVDNVLIMDRPAEVVVLEAGLRMEEVDFLVEVWVDVG